MLKDYLALNSPHQFLNPHTIAHLDSERNKLLDNLELFEMGTLDLKDSIYSLTRPACMNQLQCMEENEMLQQKIDALEFEKNVRKKALLFSLCVVCHWEKENIYAFIINLIW